MTIRAAFQEHSVNELGPRFQRHGFYEMINKLQESSTNTLQDKERYSKRHN